MEDSNSCSELSYFFDKMNYSVPYEYIEYSAPVEHPWPVKLNSSDAENEQCRHSSCKEVEDDDSSE